MKREFLTQVRKKSFIILTILAPLLLVGFGVLIGFMFKANQSEYHFEVIDKSGIFINQLKSTKDISYTFVPKNAENMLISKLKERKGTDGLLIIPELKNTDFNLLENGTKLLINKKIGMDTKTLISDNLSNILKKEKIKKLGITENQITDLDKGFRLISQNVEESNKPESDLAFGIKTVLSIGLMYIVFMFIIIYGVRVMRSVLEEKNNRVVEIIISSVKPFELMMGKILGVTLVALTQFIIWIAMSVTAAFFLNTGFSAMQKNIPPEQENILKNLNFEQIATEVSHILLDMNFAGIILVFVFFFLFGYIFYSSMYAAIGSAVDNETETQQFTLFAMIPLMLGMYGSFSIMNNPNGPMAFWLSIIPFTSPVAMIARIPFGVPFWQIFLSVVLLIISTFIMIYIASKIYKTGILMYGNKASLKEIWKWIRS